MDRVAVFVDAGYLFAQGSVLVAGEKLGRSELHLDHEAVLACLSSLATSITSLPLLRIYWYDGASAGPTSQQISLAYKPNVKLRLGSVNQHGQQKGVDFLIATDLMNLARNRAMADALLLTGDEDIRIGVQQAQEFGVRVHLLGIEPARENQSGSLMQEADSLHELPRSAVATFLTRAAPRSMDNAPPATGLLGPPRPPLVALAEQIARRLSTEEIEDILTDSAGSSIPAEVDRTLLVEGSKQTGTPLEPDQKRLLRNAFLNACRQRVGK